MDPEFTKFSTNYVDVTVKLVEGTIFDGKINIIPYKRLSDFINSRDKGFVIVIEAASSLEVHNKTVFINKNKVAWIDPKD